MNFLASDSDDSSFLFLPNVSKKRSNNIMCKNIKKIKLSTSNICDPPQSSSVSKELSKEVVNEISQNINCKDANFQLCKSTVEDNPTLSDLGVEEAAKEQLENENLVLSTNTSSIMEDDYICPLCLKKFMSQNTHTSHMKLCAKNHKMTTKELLKVLEMHKKQIKERISSGALLAPPFSPVPQALKRKKKNQFKEDSESAFQLAMALALSKSLADSNHKDMEAASDSNGSNNVTLEKFGFTSSCSTTSGLGKKKLKNLNLECLPLKQRTKEERLRRVTEKVSIVLLNDDEDKIDLVEDKKIPEESVSETSKMPKNRVPHLWELGECPDNGTWYVDSIKDLIVDKELEAGGKTIEKSSDCVNKDTTSDSIPKVPVSESAAEDIEDAITALALPKSSVYTDWKSLINNKHLSDITVSSREGQKIHMHSLVLYARCRPILDKDLHVIFSDISAVTALNFQQYLYCGTLDGLRKRDVDGLAKLANALDYEELTDVLNILKENLARRDEDEKKTDIICDESSTCSLHDSLEDTLNDYKKLEKENHRIDLTNCDSNAENEVIEALDKNENNTSQVLSLGPTNEIVSEVVKSLMQDDDSTVMYSGSVNGEDDKEERSKDVEVGVLDDCGGNNHSSGDLFEEMERLSGTTVCLTSESSKDGKDEEQRELGVEHDRTLEAPDYEIPYFDPYEHFDCEIPEPDSPVLRGEDIIQSQSLMIGEVSPLKHSNDNDEEHQRIEEDRGSDGDKTLESCADPVPIPEHCSTPLPSYRQLKNGVLNRKPVNSKRRITTSCSKIKKSSRRLSAKSKTLVKKSRKTGFSDAPEVAANLLTESILKDFNRPIQSSPGGETPQSSEPNYVEVTPNASVEEYSDGASPMPDYSVMGMATIQKHLGKYGLKKSLSRNKAKKILRHIYEELHPIVNIRSGKIVKFSQIANVKKKKKAGNAKAVKSNNTKTKARKTANKKRVESPVLSEHGAGDAVAESPRLERTNSEGNDTSFTSLDTSSRTDDASSDGSEFDVNEEPLSQTPFSNVLDASAAVFDYIHKNADIRKQILAYEPIWLEDFRNKLFEAYNKKYKLSDLMDCLDAECISFRTQSQRNNNVRQKKKKSPKKGKT